MFYTSRNKNNIYGRIVKGEDSMLQKQENVKCQNPNYKLMSKLLRGYKKKPVELG
jgi:CRISPR/Cas system-associated protein endoribonuclease Cas2